MTFALNKFLKFLPAATFAMVAEYLMGLADNVICGHIIGEEGLSAINLMQPMMNLVTFFALLVGVGSSVLYSIEMGRFEKKRASEFLTQGLWSALMFGALIMALFAILRVKVAESFGVEGVVLAGVKEYWLWFIPCALLEPVGFFFSSMCYADGDDRICAWAYAGQLTGNCVISYFLTLKFGFAGCAIGTAIGHVVTIGILLLHFKKRTNSLKFTMHFSLKDTFMICRSAIGDASSRLCQAMLFLSLNLFVVWRFGEGMLPILAVAITVLGLSEAFDGVSRAMQPLASVYIGEKNDRLTRRILRYAEAASISEGLLVTLILLAFPQLATSLVGIDDPGLMAPAHTAVRIVSLGLCGTALMALFNSYWTFLSRTVLAFSLTTLSSFVVPAVLFPSLGFALGECGVWIALAVSPYMALMIIAFFIVLRWGAKALPHFLSRARARRMRVYDLVLDDETICKTAAKLNKFLAQRRGIGSRKAGLTSLLVEEALMVVKDRNKSKRIRAEVSIEFTDKIRLTMRDDGEIFDITDTDAEISSLRAYLVSNLMVALPARRNMTTTGFNRNAFEI